MGYTPVQVAAVTPPHVPRNSSISEWPSIRTSLHLALVTQALTKARWAARAVRLRKLKMSNTSPRPPDVETTFQRVRPALSKPDNKLSEDIVKFGMNALGTLPPPRQGCAGASRRRISCQPLLYVVQAPLQGRPR